MPATEQLEFFGDEEAERLYWAALEKLKRMGGEQIEVDFTPFREVASLLYGGAWVAERLAAIRRFFADHAAEMDPVVRGIIGGGEKYSAIDAFASEYRLRDLCKEAAKQWDEMDVLVLPTMNDLHA